MAYHDVEAGIPGFALNPAGYLEAVISAARYPLSEPMRPNVQEDNLLSGMLYTFQLAVIYHDLETFWAECLWNNWYVIRTEAADWVVQPTNSETIGYLASEFRVHSISQEITFRTLFAWSEFPLEYRIDLMKLFGTARRKAKQKRFSIVPDENTDVAPERLTYAMVAEELYWNQLLEYPLPKLANLTIRRMQHGWAILGSVGEHFAIHGPKETGVKTLRDLESHVHVVRRAELLRLLTTYAKMTGEQATVFLDELIFRNVRDDLWYRPLVDLGDGLIAIILAALQVPNLVRSYEEWMQDGGLDLDLRGELFESYVRREIKSMLRESVLRANSHVHENNISLRSDYITEEVDVLLRIGTKLIVGECKCSRFPATPIEHYRYLARLYDAAEQSKRKADFVTHNMGCLVKKGFLEPAAIIDEVIPVVVSNLPFGVGTPLNGIPITDLLVLGKYFRDGKVTLFASVGQPEQRQTNDGIKPLEIPIYKSEDDAPLVLKEYLLSPPHVAVLKTFVQADRRPMMSLDKEQKPAGIIRLKMGMPQTIPAKE